MVRVTDYFFLGLIKPRPTTISEAVDPPARINWISLNAPVPFKAEEQAIITSPQITAFKMIVKDALFFMDPPLTD